MIELNYFDCRGRVQAIRNYLHERDIHFADNRVSVSDGFAEWSLKSQDKSFSGAFGLLPSMRLRKDGPLISETLVAAFEIEPAMSLEERSMISSTYNDVIENVGLMIWADMAFPGVDVKAAADIMFARMKRLFKNYDQSSLLNDNKSGSFSLAQHFVGEALDAALYVFGAKFEEALERRPNLKDFDCRYRGFLATQNRPSQFTGRPDEGACDTLKLSRS